MNQRSARLVALLPLLATATPLAGEPVLVCRGHEPEWNLRVEGPSATLAFEGQRLNFDCGPSGVDRLGLLGPLSPGPEGLLRARKAEIGWNEGSSSVRKAEPILARPAEIALLDGLTWRHAGRGATLAFDGRRASFTCGMKDGDTVALLGDLEAAEGGFRILRARIAHGAQGFTLVSSEPILVTAPR